MTDRSTKRGFASRPATAEHWIKADNASNFSPDLPSPFSARLTIDVTPAQRGQIKLAAFRRGITVTEMLRDLLGREFPADPGAAS